MSSFRRGGCVVRLTAVQEKTRRGIFSVSEAADAASREVECLLTWP